MATLIIAHEVSQKAFDACVEYANSLNDKEIEVERGDFTCFEDCEETYDNLHLFYNFQDIIIES